MKLLIVLLVLGYIAISVRYVHVRGRVRHGFFRQLQDHSSFMAPVNYILYRNSAIADQPYHPLSAFPEIQPLLDNWQAIRDEAETLQGLIKASDKRDDAGFNSFFKTGWKRFYLKWYGDSHPSAAELCPRTTALLQGIPTVKAAMFTELPVGSKLTRHRDPYAGSLRLHIGLRTPNDDRCFIDVDGQRYSWRDGEAVVFDETYIHHAENNAESDRLILFCDLERPVRSHWAQAFNRWFSKNVMAAAAAPNTDSDSTGFINRLFGKVYIVREKGKALKRQNRLLYNLLKWPLLALPLILFILIVWAL